jgi:Fic family protein
MSQRNVLSAQELAAIDATYTPIPDFAQWSQTVPRADLWDRAKAQLDGLKGEQLPEGALDTAVRTAVRAAAFDTGAIEGLYKTDRGLTMTVATQAATWQAEMEEKAPDARAYFEAQLEAYEMVLDVVTQSRPVTEVWIRQLHEVLTRPQDTYEVQTPVGPQLRALQRGMYKTDPNHVRLRDGSTHPHAPVEATSVEMGRLIEQIGTDEFLKAHPVTQASYLHYCLVSIHPFADGNGRVTRAVASIYFYRALSVPLVIFVDQRPPYLAALERADQGDREPFIGFVAEAGRAAASMVVESLLTAVGPSADTALRELSVLLSAQGGMTHHELDAVAGRLQQEVALVVGEVLDTIDLPPGVSKGGVSYGGRPRTVPAGYRVVANTVRSQTGIAFESPAPAEARVSASVEVAVAKSDDLTETFVLYDRVAEEKDTGQKDKLVLGLADVYPELTVSGQFRVRAYIERLIGRTLTDLVNEARTQLERTTHRPDTSQ